jgi:hypothetical protein
MLDFTFRIKSPGMVTETVTKKPLKNSYARKFRPDYLIKIPTFSLIKLNAMEPTITQVLKQSIVLTVGLSRDALHIYVGLAILLVMAFVLRRQLSSLIPLAIVFLVAVIGEIVDMRDDLVTMGYWRLGASLHDVVNTVFWPTILTIFHKAGLIFRLDKGSNA